jgi:hypothetical protein
VVDLFLNKFLSLFGLCRLFRGEGVMFFSPFSDWISGIFSTFWVGEVVFFSSFSGWRSGFGVYRQMFSPFPSFGFLPWGSGLIRGFD